ncbi:MAG: hypothetical protein IIC73_01920 [Armatimonadetes bacterium]|nr:hypothetical protein [Armatimonadota bacterium]
MMRRFRAVAVIAVLAMTVAPCISPAQVRKTKDGYLLRMKWTKGASYSYDITITTEIAGQSLPMNSTSSMKVLDVSGGVASVEVTAPNPMTNEPVTQTLQADSLGFLGDDGAIGGMGWPKLPKRAIRPGDSWTTETSVDVMGTALTTKTIYTFKGLERIDEVPCVVLTIKTTATTSMLNVTGAGTMYIETRTGQLYKNELNSVFEIDNNGQILTIPNQVVIIRK